MQKPSRSPKPIGRVAVHLLDPTSGRMMKSWTFTEQAKITIGRSPDQDVEMSDPYISRNHAQLTYNDGQWLLTSLGRHGVIVSDEMIAERPVGPDVCFRLGMEGPTLRFRTNVECSDELLATVSVDTVQIPEFQLDANRLQDDVKAIAEGQYFQNLRERAKQLRQKHQRD